MYKIEKITETDFFPEKIQFFLSLIVYDPIFWEKVYPRKHTVGEENNRANAK